MDPRIEKLSKTMIQYSCNVKKGERVTIDVIGDSPRLLVKQLIKDIYAVGAIPYINQKNSVILREQLLGITVEAAENWCKHDLNRLSETDVYIMLKSAENLSEMADVPPEKINIYHKHYLQSINKHILGQTNWLSMRYPSQSMAQAANMSYEAFEDMYFNVCNLDYSKMSSVMDALVDLMRQTDKVRIIGPGTDIKFSIKDIPVHKCAGEINLPDGEVYTAPVKTSVNGYITYNVPSIYNGVSYTDVKLSFSNGKIIEAESNNTEAMNVIFSSDEGARYLGEFAIGVNPYVDRPINDILFDEKIGGSFHLTPGFSYENASNGNASSVHWDLVCIQTEAYGGGEIYFDGVLIRKNGLFILDSLKALNPEALK